MTISDILQKSKQIRHKNLVAVMFERMIIVTTNSIPALTTL